eukprot:snap_masked-scaffold562_size136394-processed-gene-0.5 protein:Tk04314 transcript:snap_masked-scaffold562_size136394-processed-gene-0.5-mRNA-1 annotation:"major facilitator superfamily transporter"
MKLSPTSLSIILHFFVYLWFEVKAKGHRLFLLNSICFSVIPTLVRTYWRSRKKIPLCHEYVVLRLMHLLGCVKIGVIFHALDLHYGIESQYGHPYALVWVVHAVFELVFDHKLNRFQEKDRTKVEGKERFFT